MPTPQDIAHEEYMNQLAKNEQVRALADQIVQNAQNGTLPQATATLPRGSVGYGPVEYVTGQTRTNINYDGTAADRGPDAFGNRRGFTPYDGLYTRDQYGNEHRIENRALGAPYEVPGYGPYRGHVVNGLFLDTQAPIRAQLAPLFALAQQAMAQAPRRAAGGVGGGGNGGGVSTPRVRNDAPVSLPQVDLPDDALRARAIENDWYLPRTGTSAWHRKFIEENGLDDQPRLTFNPEDGTYTLDPSRGNQAPILESDAPENITPDGAHVARTISIPGIEGFSVPDVNIPTMPTAPSVDAPVSAVPSTSAVTPTAAAPAGLTDRQTEALLASSAIATGASLGKLFADYTDINYDPNNSLASRMKREYSLIPPSRSYNPGGTVGAGATDLLTTPSARADYAQQVMKQRIVDEAISGNARNNLLAQEQENAYRLRQQRPSQASMAQSVADDVATLYGRENGVRPAQRALNARPQYLRDRAQAALNKVNGVTNMTKAGTIVLPSVANGAGIFSTIMSAIKPSATDPVGMMLHAGAYGSESANDVLRQHFTNVYQQARANGLPVESDGGIIIMENGQQYVVYPDGRGYPVS